MLEHVAAGLIGPSSPCCRAFRRPPGVTGCFQSGLLLSVGLKSNTCTTEFQRIKYLPFALFGSHFYELYCICVAVLTFFLFHPPLYQSTDSTNKTPQVLLVVCGDPVHGRSTFLPPCQEALLLFALVLKGKNLHFPPVCLRLVNSTSCIWGCTGRRGGCSRNHFGTQVLVFCKATCNSCRCSG